MSAFLYKRGPLLAFILLAIAVIVAINISAHNTAKSAAKSASHAAAHTLYQSQQNGCARGNMLRTEINLRGKENATLRDSLVTFLLAASAAREATYQRSHFLSDKKASVAYARLAARDARLVYKQVPLVNCAKAYPKP